MHGSMNIKCKYWVRYKKIKEILPLTNFDILKMVKKNLKLKILEVFFMKDELPQKVNKTECGINSEESDEEGSHWTAYYKNSNKKYYYDSYGNIFPPKTLVKYLGSEILVYNEDMIQNFDDPPIWGHLCLIVFGKIIKR
jgi:hypothetical protein